MDRLLSVSEAVFKSMMDHRTTSAIHRFAAGILLAVIALFIFDGRQASGSNLREIGIVMVKDLNVKSEPSEHGFLQKRLKKGTRIKIIKHHRGWLQIIHGGEVGFIRDDDHLVKIIRQKKIDAKKKISAPTQKSTSQIDKLKQQKQDVDQKIKKSESEVQKITRKEIAIIESLNAADRALNKSRKRLSAIASEMKKLEQKKIDTTKESEDLMQQIKINQQYVALRLVALYKLNQLGQIHVLATADTVQDLLQRQAALEKILTYDQKIRAQLEKDRARLEGLLSGIKKYENQNRVLYAEYNKQLDRVSRERSQRAKLLAEVRNQKSLELAAIETLKNSAKALDQELSNLTQKADTASKEQNIQQLSIAQYKGLLNMPVNGKIITLYGPYKNTKFNVINFRSGIDIEAEKGDPVRAVYGGKIVYSNWFKGYGNMIIIDHGTNYHTVYAHVEDMFKSKGDIVESGEVIATVGDTGSITGSKLHFEVRHHGKAVDPMIWLKKS
jgi:septal ring factor EnvC (AmiA/AmiB activator)